MTNKEPICRLVVAIAYTTYKKRGGDFRFNKGSSTSLHISHASIWKANSRIYIGTDSRRRHSEVRVYHIDRYGNSVTHSSTHEFEDPNFVQSIVNNIERAMDVIKDAR